MFNPRPKKNGDVPLKMMPWVEKYRPKSIKDVSAQEDVTATLTASIETRNLPHLLFYGPPGTGKTSTVLAIAHELYGQQLYKARILELNASDERGIKVVRDKIKLFAQTAVGSNDMVNGRPCPPFKLIILDEADSMTQDAQAALRRTMETYSKITRFCLICNYVTRIIEPLASRCAKFRFRPLDKGSMEGRLQMIAQGEGLKFKGGDQAGVLDTIMDLSGGDMRRAIQLMQSSKQLHGPETPIGKEEVVEISGLIPDAVLASFWAAVKTNLFSTLEAEVETIVADGYSAAFLVKQLHQEVVKYPAEDMSSLRKAKISIRMAEVDKHISEGADELLQLVSMASYIQQVFHDGEGFSPKI